MRIGTLTLLFLLLLCELMPIPAACEHLGRYYASVNVGSGLLPVVSDDTSEVPYRGQAALAGPVITASGPLSFCPGSSVILTITGAPAGSVFLWSNGQTTRSITVTATGIYSARVTLKKGQCVRFTPPVTVTVASLSTDLNTDGVVNVSDYMILNSNFNAPCTGCAYDYFQDGFIDTRDFLFWLKDIFKTCN